MSFDFLLLTGGLAEPVKKVAATELASRISLLEIQSNDADWRLQAQNLSSTRIHSHNEKCISPHNNIQSESLPIFERRDDLN